MSVNFIQSQFFRLLRLFAALLPKLAFWLVVCFAVILIPAKILKESFGEFSRKLHEVKRDAAFLQAREVLAKFERALDPGLIVSETLNNFKSLAQKKLTSSPLNGDSSAILEKRLRKNIPADSVLLWFNADHKLTVPSGKSRPVRMRVWQDFYNCLSQASVQSEDDIRRGEGLMKIVFGELINMTLLKKAVFFPYKVFYETKNHYFSILNFFSPADRKFQGALLILIPIDQARHGWELDHAIKKIRMDTRNAVVGLGGAWISSGVATATFDLGTNLVEGLRGRFENGMGNYELGNFFYSGKYWSFNPDLFLVVEIRGDRDFIAALSIVVDFTKSCFDGIGIILIILAFFIVFGGMQFAVTLESKFKWTVALLAVFPLITLMVLSSTYLLKTRQIQEEELRRKLDGVLSEIENTMVEEIQEVDRQLRKTINQESLWKNLSMENLKLLHGKLKKAGLQTLLVIPPDDDFEVIGGRKKNPLINWFVSMVVEKMGFGKKEKLSYKAKSELGMVTSELTPDSFERTMKKFQPMIFGEKSRYILHSFSTTKTGERVAYFSMFFDYNVLCGFLLEKTMKKILRQYKISPRNLSIRQIGDSVKGSLEVQNSRMREWLDLVEYTGQPLRAVWSDSRGDLQVFARPLKGLSSIGLIMGFNREFEASRRLTLLLLLLLSLLAAVSARLASDLLPEVFLKPLLGLGEAVARVDRGEYKVEMEVRTKDELGLLSRSFNEMMAGLREKERMTPFLQKKLVESASSLIKDVVERRYAVVSFSGLRRFSALEAALSPRAAMAVMTRFLGLCEDAVKEHGGEIDKFIGDSAMAVFLEEDGLESPQRRALLSAITLDGKVRTWLEERRRIELPVFQHGTGIAGGEVLMGSIGSLKKYRSSTVIGDIVNLAARLEKLAGTGDNPSILATKNLLDNAGSGFSPMPTGIDSVRGRKDKIEVVGITGGKA